MLNSLQTLYSFRKAAVICTHTGSKPHWTPWEFLSKYALGCTVGFCKHQVKWEGIHIWIPLTDKIETGSRNQGGGFLPYLHFFSNVLLNRKYPITVNDKFNYLKKMPLQRCHIQLLCSGKKIVLLLAILHTSYTKSSLLKPNIISRYWRQHLPYGSSVVRCDDLPSLPTNCCRCCCCCCW